MNVDKYHSEVATFKAQNSKSQRTIVIRTSSCLNQSRMKQETILMLALGVIFIGGSFVGVTGLPPRPGMYYLYGKQSII